MSTVDKALSLLEFLDERRTEIGLSELSRLAGQDKATTLRMMTALARAGLIEQHPVTRLYRLGAGILRLARIREAAFPVGAVLQPMLEHLARDSGETAHASLFTGGRLVTIGIVEGDKSTRVRLEAGQILPLHATASGAAFLAYAPEPLLAQVLDGEFEVYTNRSPPDRIRLSDWIGKTRRAGVAVADQTFETEVTGIAAPVFDAGRVASGALAVATPSHRMTAALRGQISDLVRRAALEATRGMGGEPPAVWLQGLARKVAA
jgi:IclR family transcriptional regulator, acetate operon repressor